MQTYQDQGGILERQLRTVISSRRKEPECLDRGIQ